MRVQMAMKDSRFAALVLGDQQPPWVTFPRVERSAWLNLVVEQLWPSIVAAFGDTLRNSLDPLLETYQPSFLSKLKMDECSLGALPLHIAGVTTHEDTDDSTYIDIEVVWAGDSDIRLIAGVNMVEVQVKLADFTLRGLLRVVLGPHCRVWPCFSHMAFSFIGKPIIDFKLKAAKLPLDAIPGLSQWLDHFVRDTVAWLLVHPKQYVLQIVADTGRDPHSVADPAGTLVIVVHSAEGLPKKFLQSSDTNVLGTCTSGDKESVTATVRGATSPDYGNKRMTFTAMNTPDERVVLTVHDRFSKIGHVELFTAAVIERSQPEVRHSTRIVATSGSHKNVGKLQFTSSFEPLVPVASMPPELLEEKMRGRMPGVLVARVVKATKLQRAEFLGAITSVLRVGQSSSRFYVKLSNEHVLVKTHPSSGATLEPVFDETVLVDFRDAAHDAVKVEVCTVELAMDHTIGTGSIELRDILGAQGRAKPVVRLEPGGEVQFELKMLLRCTAAEAASAKATQRAGK